MAFLQQFFNVVDIAVGVVLLLGLIGGIRRGLSGELFRIISMVLAVVAGWKFAGEGADWLAGRTDWPPEDLTTPAFFGIIAASYIVLAIVRLALRLVIDFSFKGKLELLGGALLGLSRSLLLCAVLLLGTSLLPYPKVQEALAASVTGGWTRQYLRPAYDNFAARHPDLELPVSEDTASEGEPPALLDTPAYEEYLGPLIDSEDDHGN